MRRRYLFALLFSLLLLPAPAITAGEPPLSVRFLLSNSAPFAGEEVILTLEVSYPRRPGGRMTVRWPQCGSCVVADLGSGSPRRMAEGDTTRLVESARRLLRPLAPGRLQLVGGIELQGAYWPAPPLELRVRPLPAAGRPPTFAGAVGQAEMELRAAGTGAREVELVLRGNAPLDAFPAPQVRLGRNERLVALGEALSGKAGEIRERRFHYLFLPGEGRRGTLAFALALFDPGPARYREMRVELPKEPGSFRAAGLSALMVSTAGGLLLGYARRRRRRSLDQVLTLALGRPAGGLDRERIRDGLQKRGIRPATIDELTGLWAAEDRRRFAPGPPSDAAGDLDARQGKVAIRLANDIDKHRRFPYFHWVIGNLKRRKDPQ